VRASWIVAPTGTIPRFDGHSEDRPIPREPAWHAYRQYFRDVEDRRLSVIFDRDLLPGTHGFPVGDGGANVGFGVLRSMERDPSNGKRLAASGGRCSSSPPSAVHSVGSSTRRHAPCLADPSAYHGPAGPRRVLFAGDPLGSSTR